MEQTRGRQRSTGAGVGDTLLAIAGLAAAAWGIYATVTADRFAELLGTGIAFLACAIIVLLKAVRLGGIPRWSPAPSAILWNAVALATLLLLIMLPGKLIQFAIGALRN